MTTSVSSSSDIRWIPTVRPYTGTSDQPDVITVFLKSRENAGEVKTKDDQTTNILGYSPSNYLLAFPRIRHASKVMFRELTQGTLFNGNSEFWIAFQNFSRGVVQLIPFLGNGVLYLHDLARTTFFIHPKLKTALSHEQEPVVGIAFDGKPVFTIPLSTVKSRMNYPDSKDENSILNVIHYLWLSLRAKAVETNARSTTRQIAERLRECILNYRATPSTSTQ
jgi:hypothetical protein